MHNTALALVSAKKDNKLSPRQMLPLLNLFIFNILLPDRNGELLHDRTFALLHCTMTTKLCVEKANFDQLIRCQNFELTAYEFNTSDNVNVFIFTNDIPSKSSTSPSLQLILLSVED